MTALFISHSSKDNDWAKEIREKLSGEGYQSLFLDFHPDDGIHTGEDWEQTLYQKLRQCRGVVALCSRDWLESPWCVSEAILARERGKPVFLLATADITDKNQDKKGLRIPKFLQDKQFISLEGLTKEEAHERLWKGLDKKRLKDDFALPERPYPGLEPFTEDDAAVFFGRDAKIDEVRDTLERRRSANAKGFILVLGASGCGKSSLVKAGVLPRLRKPKKLGEAEKDWIVADPFPGGEGLNGLAESLVRLCQESGLSVDASLIRERIKPTGESEDEVERAARALNDLAIDLRGAAGHRDARVLLVADQLEEVFGTEADSEARLLLRLLFSVTRPMRSPVVVLATMRSDFLNSFQLFPGVSEEYEKITLDPMPKERFGEVIEGPAERFGLRLDSGLTERLVEDTAYDDALPLLAFTLKELYEKCEPDGRLSIKAYEALFPPVELKDAKGKRTVYRGVTAAIKHVADKILEHAHYQGLPPDSARLRDLRRAFHLLAQVGEADQVTKRKARWSQMPASCEAVLQLLVDKRLLVSDTEADQDKRILADPRKRTLSVAHEALFRVWDTLRDWLHQDLDALRLRGQIEDAARQWNEAGQKYPPWSEERVIDTLKEIADSGVSLEGVEQAEVVRQFLGPSDVKELMQMLQPSSETDGGANARAYGEAWRLPLGHKARASAGVRLALLGDPREGVGLREDGLPEIDWRPVEDGGEVTIEILRNPDNPSSEVVDTKTQRVEPFSIARYPVTIAQFKAFMDACYQDGHWLTPPGFPVTLTDDYPPPKHRASYPNHPADSVNWWDAMAFCAWLSDRLDLEIRLPTEFEWQLAATRGDLEHYKYPWGPEWEPQQESWRANTAESGLNRSTAVGLYPEGASPVGALDMAGNLWEWCVNSFDQPESLEFPASGEDHRVLRGGSWFSARDNARCSVRNRFGPDDRSDYLGFRLLCSSPIV